MFTLMVCDAAGLLILELVLASLGLGRTRQFNADRMIRTCQHTLAV